jgi:polysaccharide export outer membrane protein
MPARHAADHRSPRHERHRGEPREHAAVEERPVWTVSELTGHGGHGSPVLFRERLGNQSLDEAQDAVFRHLKRVLKEPQVSLTLAQAAGQQQIAGEHLVGPDGTINLGTYGSVFVTGLTLEEAKVAIEKHLGQFLDAPLVSIDVFAYNSKVYYVVTEGAGFGDNIARFPVTGNETVLDAISQISGLSRLSSKDIWIARPAPSGVGCDQVLPVDIEAIMKGGSTATNYQLLPGDRVFIAQDQWIAFDSIIGKVTAPFERIFGFTLLGTSLIQQINRFPFGFNPNNFCWVAREVYGEHNPQWLLFRAWLLTDAPIWLRDTYAAHGEDVAAWIHDKGLKLLKPSANVRGDFSLDVRFLSGHFNWTEELKKCRSAKKSCEFCIS